MKSQVFVLIPFDVPPENIDDVMWQLLEPHHGEPGSAEPWRYDYLVGPLTKSFDDPVAEGVLPHILKRAYAGNICECANLPPELVPAALVTPDGEWYGLLDYDWAMMRESCESNRNARAKWEKRYRELIAEHPYCWVLEVWAHS